MLKLVKVVIALFFNVRHTSVLKPFTRISLPQTQSNPGLNPKIKEIVSLLFFTVFKMTQLKQQGSPQKLRMP